MAMDAKTAQMLQEIFRAELFELHQSLIDGLLALEKITSKKALEENLSELFRFSHNMKGAASSVSVTIVATIAHRLEDLFSEWRTNQHFPSKNEISACIQVVDNILHAAEAHARGEKTEVDLYLAPLTGGKYTTHDANAIQKQEYIKVPLIRIEQASAKANEFINYQLKLDNWFKEISHALQTLNKLSDDNVYRTFLIKKMNTISNKGGQFFGEFSRSVQGLQDEFKNMRMLPISTVLLPLNRTVRDLSKKLNKSVELRIEGGDIELDKNVLEAIRDPLQHLVRNAIDHGIESNAQRKKLNKPVPAIINIRITQVAGKIKLIFSDDGRGMNLEKIKEKALAAGIYSKKELEAFDATQILNCIFTSGFSTQKEVTEISGRGVGLDIVKTNIQKIKGDISVTTTPGKGSQFTLILPSTLATSRCVFFKIKNQLFMIPTILINGLYSFNTDSLKLVDNKYMMVIAKKPVPIITLGNLLKIESSAIVQGNYYGILISYQTQNLILLVDGIMDEHACTIKQLPFPYSQLDHFIGVALSGENDIVLVLDPSVLIQMIISDETFSRKEDTILEVAQNESEVKKRILIVDDSLTTRVLCSNAVAAAGYEAISTTDGQKAWELLQKEKFDCVITDILMPVMDGFELTKLIKNDKKLAQTPVIIVSSLDSSKDKKKGLELGASAFIVKSEFDTRALIEMMESLI